MNFKEIILQKSQMAAGDRFNNGAATYTFCDQGENHIGNQKIGELAPEGFTFAELQEIETRLRGLGVEVELINLGSHLPPEFGSMNTGVLIIRNGVSIFVNPPDLVWDEVMELNYDRHALMYGQVREKHARHNLVVADVDQEPDYAVGKGRIVSFDHLPLLSNIRAYLPTLLNEKATGLIAEANLYYDVTHCGIGYHGDKERKIVVGVRLGTPFPLVYQWYHQSQRIGPRIDLELLHGDIYVMDQKACGFDAAKRKIPTLRHAAGCEKYIK